MVAHFVLVLGNLDSGIFLRDMVITGPGIDRHELTIEMITSPIFVIKIKK